MGKLGGTSAHVHMATWNAPDCQEREVRCWKRERIPVPPTPTSLLKRCTYHNQGCAQEVISGGKFPRGIKKRGQHCMRAAYISSWWLGPRQICRHNNGNN